MKTLFNPIKGLFGKKSDESPEADQDESSACVTPCSDDAPEMDDTALAKQHYGLFHAVNDVIEKLEKLEGAKKKISEDRYQSLFDQYNTLLTKKSPLLQELIEEIDQRIIGYVGQKKEAAYRFSQLKKGSAQEEKLLKDGLISKEDYIKKIKSMRPKEKSCAEAYKILKKKIEFLKEVKENRYVPSPESDGHGGADEVDSDGEKKSSTLQESRSQALKDETLYGKEVVLPFPSGVTLDVKISDIAIPVTSHFVGADALEYIQIAPPSPYNTIKGKLTTGNLLAFQSIFKGRRYRFSSQIIEHLTKPIRAVILSYPDKLEVKDLRASDRVSCRIPATIFYKGKAKEAILIDISPVGCGVDVHYEPQEKNYIVRRNESIKLECSFPGDPEHYPMNGIVKNVKKKQLRLIYGIQLVDLTEDAQNVIARYISLAKA